MTVQEAIEEGNDDALKALLADDARLADLVIRWGPEGKNGSVPLQYVCDMVFEGPLDADRALPLVEALLTAGADIDAPHERHGDTPLIAAASLLCEDVGLRLIAAGADVRARGLFGATALHWAALLGLDRLADRLITAGADITWRDDEHTATPLGWAIHGWQENPQPNTRRQPAVVRRLRAAGMQVPPEARAELDASRDAEMVEALS